MSMPIDPRVHNEPKTLNADVIKAFTNDFLLHSADEEKEKRYGVIDMTEALLTHIGARVEMFPLDEEAMKLSLKGSMKPWGADHSRVMFF